MTHTRVAEPVGQVDLLSVPRGPRPTPHAWSALLKRLPPAERHRIGSVYQHRGQHDSALGWGLLTDLAGRHQVEVWRGASGRPMADRPVDVSLSHGGGWVVAAAYRQGRVGVDVEGVREVSAALARRCLSPAELSWLETAADPTTRVQRFLRLWTAKEAYLKAIGTGLGMDPRMVTIDCTAPIPQLVGPAASRWEFRSSVPAEAVRVTLCLERAP